MASRRARSSPDGGRREDGAEEGRSSDLGGEGENGSASSQAGAFSGLEDEGGLDGEARRSVDTVGDARPEGAASSPEAALRDQRDRADALRDAGDRGEARAKGAPEEGDGVRPGHARSDRKS